MNAFYLAKDPKLAAMYHGDKHIIFQILVVYRLLTTIESLLDSNSQSLVHRRWVKQPWAQWGILSPLNYQWLKNHFKALLNEYTYRWHKQHMYKLRYMRFAIRRDTMFCNAANWSFPDTKLTPPPLTIPSLYISPNAVESYRMYYLGAKTDILTYTRRAVPTWVIEEGLGEQK